MTLTIMYRLYGVTAAEFYKQDPERFVRTSLMTQKLLGMPKLYISWPVYGFTAEALGQEMIYSDQYSPGTDPDTPLANSDNWQDIATPDMNAGIPKILDETLASFQRLTGNNPVLHLTAAYSLAADIYGQEQIITALTHEPEFVNRFLDHLVDTVLKPWMDHFFSQYPDGWVELSDVLPVYGFTAEALGQEMIYSDQYSPGTDPDTPLANSDNWQDIATPDMNAGIPKILDETLASFQRLTGNNPVLHLTAAYSLAADIYGQEQIITALTHEPEFVNRFLDHLVDTVLKPWMDHFFSQYPDGWVELSDASGSPFFIGPQNCKNVAIRSTQRLIAGNSWGERVYDANYRGDYVTRANKGKASSSRRRNSRKSDSEQLGLVELFELKNSVCPDYVISLADDRTPVSFYVEQAIKSNIPLFIGIGATQVDRNSIADLEIAKQDIGTITSEYVEAIKTVARTIENNGYDLREPPWPGTVYFEDISAESSFELIEIIVDTTLKQGAL